MALVAVFSGASAGSLRLRQNGRSRTSRAYGGVVFAGICRSVPGLVDVWTKADQARRRSGCAGTASAGTLSCVAQGFLYRRALCADDSAAGLVDSQFGCID